MILVTGATGFIGSAVLRRLSAEGAGVLGSVRASAQSNSAAPRLICVGDMTAQTDWSSAMRGVSTVLHTAARVHVMSDTAADPTAEYLRVNTYSTLNLARQAAAAGVRRFIFLSSIKVNGELTLPGTAFRADDVPCARDPYGASKLEAEQGLFELGRTKGMEIIVIRSPLVYGPGVKANFLSMIRWLSKGVPLPFGAINNRRSLVALDNLVDLIVLCLEHPAAANQIFLASDDEDLSTTQLLQRIGHALNKPARLIPVPAWFLVTVGKAIGKKEIVQRLCGSLQIDISKTRKILGWVPPISVNEGLCRTVAAYHG